MYIGHWTNKRRVRHNRRWLMPALCCRYCLCLCDSSPKFIVAFLIVVFYQMRKKNKPTHKQTNNICTAYQPSSAAGKSLSPSAIHKSEMVRVSERNHTSFKTCTEHWYERFWTMTNISAKTCFFAHPAVTTGIFQPCYSSLLSSKKITKSQSWV